MPQLRSSYGVTRMWRPSLAAEKLPLPKPASTLINVNPDYTPLTPPAMPE